MAENENIVNFPKNENEKGRLGVGDTVVTQDGLMGRIIQIYDEEPVKYAVRVIEDGKLTDRVEDIDASEIDEGAGEIDLDIAA